VCRHRLAGHGRLRQGVTKLSYGTIMIGKLKKPGTGQALCDAAKKWEERKAPGFQGNYVLLSDDGTTVVSCVSFESKDSYLALGSARNKTSGGSLRWPRCSTEIHSGSTGSGPADRSPQGDRR